MPEAIKTTQAASEMPEATNNVRQYPKEQKQRKQVPQKHT